MKSSVVKSLDIKVANILADSSCNDFILADAKDADMSAGMAAPGMATGMNAMQATPGMATGMTPGAPTMTGRSVTTAIERDSPVRQRDLVKLRRSLKMDSLARLLGLLGFLLGLGGVLGVVLLALSVRKRLSLLEDQGRRGREEKSSDA